MPSITLRSVIRPPLPTAAGRAATLMLIAAAVLAGCGRPRALDSGAEAGAPAAANVVLVVVDTLRPDHLGCYGYERDTSPTIDRLAARGVRFESVQATSPWTVPSTASILTSRYPSEHGAEVTGDVRNLNTQPPNQIRDDVRMLSELLSERGFSTALLSANPFLFGRFKSGFGHAVVERMPADRLTAETIAWIDRLPAGARFFAHVQYMDLHQPLEPPPPYWSLFATPGAGSRDSRHSEWAFAQGEHLETAAFRAFRENRVALYDGAVRFVDDQIGVLLAALADRGLESSTLLLVTSDHGEEFWDHAEMGAAMGGDPRGYYGIGHGQAFFQELLHVPLVVAGPGVSGATTVAGPASLLDIAPTVLGRVEIPTPPEMHGLDLGPALAPRSAGTVRLAPRAMFASSPAYGPEAWAMLSGGRKLIVRSDGHRLLFDLSADPGERDDLSVAQSQLVESYEAELNRHRAAVDDGRPSSSMEIDDQLHDALRALGYVE